MLHGVKNIGENICSSLHNVTSILSSQIRRLTSFNIDEQISLNKLLNSINTFHIDLDNTLKEMGNDHWIRSKEIINSVNTLPRVNTSS